MLLGEDRNFKEVCDHVSMHLTNMLLGILPIPILAVITSFHFSNDGG